MDLRIVQEISDQDKAAVYSNVLQYMNMQQSLRSQNEQLVIAKANHNISLNPMSISDTDVSQWQSSLTPVQFEKLKTDFLEARQKAQQKDKESNFLIANWGNAGEQARISTEVRNKTFDTLVNKMIDQGKGKVSIDEAEVLVAASAGSNVSVFEKSLENKLLNGNPENIISATHQISMLDSMEQARAYDGIPSKAKAIATLFQQQRGSMPDVDLARKITDSLVNIDETVQKH